MLEDLRRQAPWLVAGEAVILVGLIGAFDYLTGPELSFSVFYTVPIGLVVWAMGWKAGLGVSLFSAVVWFWADYFSFRQYSHMVIPYWNAVVRLAFFLLISFTLSALRNALDREYLMARTDPLTGAANARHFEQAGSEAIARLGTAKEPFTLVYVDLDNFKQVNDRFGHSRGDVLLHEVCTAIRSVLRTGDTVARLGGDEFGVLLAGVGADTAKDVAGRIFGKLSLPALENEAGVTVSMGAVTVTVAERPQSFDEVIKSADALMYEVKTSGKKGYRWADFRPKASGG